jgi:DNA-binding XRE family transcriptional regulator
MAKSDKANRDISHRLRVARIALGLSEREAADKAGISITQYRACEAGAHELAPAKHIADTLGICWHWCLSGNGAKIKPHLTNTTGKVAILPMPGPYDRQVRKVLAAEAGQSPASDTNAQIMARANFNAAIKEALRCGAFGPTIFDPATPDHPTMPA